MRSQRVVSSEDEKRIWRYRGSCVGLEAGWYSSAAGGGWRVEDDAGGDV